MLPLLLRHDAAGGLEHVEVAAQVDAHDAVEFVAAVGENRLPHVDRRRADETVERTLRGRQLLEARTRRVGVGDVHPDRARLPASGDNLCRRRRGGSFVHVEAGDVRRALIGGAECNRFTDAAAGADNGDHFAREREDVMRQVAASVVVRRSSFGVRRSAFGVRRSAFRLRRTRQSTAPRSEHDDEGDRCGGDARQRRRQAEDSAALRRELHPDHRRDAAGD